MVEELVQVVAALQILNEGVNRHAGAGEDSIAAVDPWIA
jgi:hypothetical protein